MFGHFRSRTPLFSAFLVILLLSLGCVSCFRDPSASSCLYVWPAKKSNSRSNVFGALFIPAGLLRRPDDTFFASYLLWRRLDVQFALKYEERCRSWLSCFFTRFLFDVSQLSVGSMRISLITLVFSRFFSFVARNSRVFPSFFIFDVSIVYCPFSVGRWVLVALSLSLSYFFPRFYLMCPFVGWGRWVDPACACGHLLELVGHHAPSAKLVQLSARPD